MMPREPKRIGIVDVETTPIVPGRIPRTKFWGAYIEHGSYQRFKDARSFVRYTLKNPDTRWYYHHDYEITQLLVEGLTPDSMRARGSRIIRASIGGQEWINSFALFPSSLAEILESAGYEKHPLNAPGHPLGCECAACEKALERRNYSDCVEALIAFRRISNSYCFASGVDPLGEGKATAASCSFQAAERLAGPLPSNHHYRGCYRGGRVEATRLGNCGPAEYFDINSSYPFAFTDAPETDTLVHAYVTVKTNRVSPFFRHAPEDKGRTFLFPQGTYETMFFESNYERYIRPNAAGVVLDIQPIERVKVDLRWLQKVAPLMRRGYKLRQLAKEQGNEAMKYALKILLNSCYGRIGMKPIREQCKIVADVPADCAYYSLPNGRSLVFTKQYLAHVRANFLYAGWITDNARARLYAGLANSEPYYFDTDGIFCRPGSFRLPVGNGLGQWKQDGKKPLYVHTVKDYKFGKTVKRKGGLGYNLWTVKRVLKGKPVTRIEKTRKTEYDKREIWSGGRTTPLIVNE